MEELRIKLKILMEQKGYSQSSVANSLQVSSSALSQYLSGKYNGNVKKIDEDVKNFIDREAEKERQPLKKVEFIQTVNAKKVYDTARFCHLDGEIGVIYGDAGTGKTTAVKEYVKKHKDAILIEADLGFSTKILFKKLHDALHLDGQGHIHDLFEGVVEKLKGSGRLIIIDEAEHLPYRALEMVRRINDFAEIGILLVGMPRLINNLRGERGNYAQLYSRIGMAVRLDALAQEDTIEIVKSLLPSANGVWKEFHRFSKGNTRVLVKMILRAKRLAQINNCGVNAEIVKSTFEMLIA